MDRNYRNERYYFRFVGISPKLALLLKEKFPHWEVDINKFKDGENFVASFKLLAEKDYSELTIFIKENKILQATYGLFIALESNKDMDGVSVPHYVLEVYKKIGGNFDFSFSWRMKFKKIGIFFQK